MQLRSRVTPPASVRDVSGELLLAPLARDPLTMHEREAHVIATGICHSASALRDDTNRDQAQNSDCHDHLLSRTGGYGCEEMAEIPVDIIGGVAEVTYLQ